MPITQGSIALTIFQADAGALQRITADSLKHHAISPMANGEEKAAGFAPLTDPLCDPSASGWNHHPEIGEYTAFCLRLDSRKVHGALLKRHLRDALAEEEKKNREAGKKFISRERKKEIRETVKLRLLARTEPVPAAHEVVIGTNGTVYLASVSKGVISALQERFLASFNCELTEMFTTAFTLDEQDKAADFLTRIAREGMDAGGCSIHSTGQVMIGDSDKRITGVSLTDSEIEELQAAMANGMRVCKTGIRIESGEGEECSMTVTPFFQISGMKLPAVDRAEEDGDPDAPFLERMYLLEKYTGILLEAFRAFLSGTKA